MLSRCALAKAVICSYAKRMSFFVSSEIAGDQPAFLLWREHKVLVPLVEFLGDGATASSPLARMSASIPSTIFLASLLCCSAEVDAFFKNSIVYLLCYIKSFVVKSMPDIL
jgi:hypothetical protein